MTGSSVIQAMLKRLAEEETQFQQQKAEGSVDVARPPRSWAAQA